MFYPTFSNISAISLIKKIKFNRVVAGKYYNYYTITATTALKNVGKIVNFIYKIQYMRFTKVHTTSFYI